MPKRARTELTPPVKKDICLYKQRHPKASQEVIAADVGRTHSITIGRSTVSDVLKEKQKWLASDLTSSTKRHRPAKHAELEEALFLWQSELAARRVPLSDELLQSKAKEFGTQLSIADFAYSRGWLQNFKKRYGIKSVVIHGEAGGVNAETLSTGRQQLRDLLGRYRLADVYNFDETGLFYRLEPNRTLATGPVHGTKKCKDRLTIGLCANADGSDKVVPFVIGKAARPRCFGRNFDVQTLVTYRHNKKAWMTSDLFCDFLKQFDGRMRREDRDVLLLLDNASSHKHDIELSNVTLHFLPPNTTSHLQPMDAGIIQNFKVHYKKLLMRLYVDMVDAGNEISRIDVKQAVYFVRDAWRSVKTETLANCFRHTGIFPPSADAVALGGDHIPQADFDELEQLVDSIAGGDDTLSAREFVELETQVQTGDQLTDDQILSIVAPGDDAESDEDEDTDPPPRHVSLGAAHDALADVLLCLEAHQEFDVGDIDNVRSLMKRVHQLRLRKSSQPSILSMFQRV